MSLPPDLLRGLLEEGLDKNPHEIGLNVHASTPKDPGISVVCSDPDYVLCHPLVGTVRALAMYVRKFHSNVRITDLARDERELSKLQQQLRLLRMEIIKLRKENTDLKQNCESLQKEADVNSRMIDEVVARRVGECFADEGARAIEAILTIRSGIVDLNELGKAMRLSCEDAVELFTMLGWADLVGVKEGKAKLTSRGEKVAERLDELG